MANNPSSGDGFEVGYARPPAETRFKPGQSGNPRGRPKGSRSVGAILNDVMGRKISITENGKTRRVSAIEGMLHRLRSEALRGDKAALKMLLPLFERYAERGEGGARLDDLLPEDLEILARYVRADEHATQRARLDETVDPTPLRNEDGEGAL